MGGLARHCHAFIAEAHARGKLEHLLKGAGYLYSKPGYDPFRRRIAMVSGLKPWLLFTYYPAPLGMGL